MRPRDARAVVVFPPCRVRERVPESIERMRAVDRADEPLTGSRVPDVQEHALCRPVPEEGDLDPIALADRELVKRGRVCGNTSTG